MSNLAKEWVDRAVTAAAQSKKVLCGRGQDG